jgi:uncharacterized RDD family membrane protein YckC
MTDQNNPYAPPENSPSHDDCRGVILDAHGRFVPASLFERFAAAIIDVLFGMAVLFAAGTLAGLLRYGEIMLLWTLRERTSDLAGIVDMVTPLLVLACQGALIAARGQSVGKVAMRTRIVLADGRTAEFYRAFVLRTLLFTGPSILVNSFYAPQSVQSLLNLVLFIDLILIFSSSRQCGHDRIAGTFVAKAR